MLSHQLVVRSSIRSVGEKWAVLNMEKCIKGIFYCRVLCMHCGIVHQDVEVVAVFKQPDTLHAWVVCRAQSREQRFVGNLNILNLSQ